MCECVATINNELAKCNSVLETTLFSSWVLLRTEKIDQKKRGRQATLAASFCPFCGKRYPRKPPTLQSPES